MHASWNALLRGGADRKQSMLVMNVTVGIAGIAMMAVAGLPSSASALYVIASGLIHLIYNALLVKMYRSGDLGETYPVARGSSPALVALGGSVFAGEWMNIIGTVGIGLVCGGIFMLAAARARSAKANSGSVSDRAPQPTERAISSLDRSNHGGSWAVHLREMNLSWALTTGVSIAAYTVVDGIGVRASGNWVAYTGGMFAFFLAVPFWYLARRQPMIRGMTSPQVGMAASGGLISLAGLRRDHLGNAVESNGCRLGAARNQRGIRGIAGGHLPARTVDASAHRRLLHHCGWRDLCRLEILTFDKRKRPSASRGV